MSLFHKHIIKGMKIPFLIFCLLYMILTFMYFTTTTNDGLSKTSIIDIFNSLLVVGIITALLSSLIMYRYLLSENHEMYSYQGALKRNNSFFTPLVSQVVFFLIIDVILLILLYIIKSDILVVFSSKDKSELYTTLSYGMMTIKYLVVFGLFFLFNISINFKTFIMGTILLYYYTLYVYVIAMAGELLVFILCLLFALCSFIVYKLRVKYHKTALLRIINYSMLISLILGLSYRSFISRSYLTSGFSLDIGSYAINIIPFLILICFIFAYSKFYDQKRPSFKNFIYLLLVPVIIGSFLYNTTQYLYTHQIIYNIDEIDSTLEIGDNSESLIILDKMANSKELIKDIKLLKMIEVNGEDVSKLNQEYIDNNNLVLISSYKEKISFLNDYDEFLHTLEKNGVTSKGAFIIDTNINDEVNEEYSSPLIFRISNKKLGKINLPEYQNYEDSYVDIIASNIYNELKKLEYKFIYDNNTNSKYIQVSYLFDKKSNSIGLIRKRGYSVDDKTDRKIKQLIKERYK